MIATGIDLWAAYGREFFKSNESSEPLLSDSFNSASSQGSETTLVKGVFEIEQKEERKKDTFECTKLGQVLLCFSWYSNFKKIFATRAGEGDRLDCLNAVRVMSMGWVILGHMYANRIRTPPLANPLDVLDTFK
jgi:hypothetical protein